jgi:hypothetical protein
MSTFSCVTGSLVLVYYMSSSCALSQDRTFGRVIVIFHETDL